MMSNLAPPLAPNETINRNESIDSYPIHLPAPQRTLLDFHQNNARRWGAGRPRDLSQQPVTDNPRVLTRRTTMLEFRQEVILLADNQTVPVRDNYRESTKHVFTYGGYSGV